MNPNNLKPSFSALHTWLSPILVLCLISLSACGYHFFGGGTLPGGAERVFVGIFSNRSDQTGVEGVVSNDIRYELTRNGKTIAPRREAADAVLSGTVLSVISRAISRQSILAVQEEQVTVKISLRLTDPNGKVIWHTSGLSDYEDYAVASDKATTEENKRAAISVASRRIAEKAYSLMTDNF